MLPKNFIPEFKRAGFKVTNEPACIERLEEARDWQFALMTLLRSGPRVGIQFAHSKRARLSVHDLAQKFQMRPNLESQLATI